MHDILSNIDITQVAAPQAITSAAVTSGNIDTQGTGTLAVAVLLGTFADTLNSGKRVDLKIEHADDDGSGAPAAYAACTDADVQGAEGLAAGVFAVVDANGEAAQRYVIGYCGGKRFVKVTAVPTGLSSGGTIALLTLAGNLAQAPV